MSFNLKKKQPFKRVDQSLKKLLQPEYFALLTKRVGEAHQIEDFSQNFIPILVRWSFEAFFKFCVEQGVFSALANGGTTKEMLFDLGWKNEVMLQDLLNALVDQSILNKKQREYIPSAFIKSGNSDYQDIRIKYGLKYLDKDWIRKSAGYRIIFTFYNKLISSFLMDSMITGNPTTSLKGSEPSQLTTIYDSLQITPSYAIPRMAAIAYAIAKRNPKTILDLNCSTGRGTEEILRCKSNAEMVLGVDQDPFQLEIAQRNIEAQHASYDFREESTTFRKVDYSKSLSDQLGEFTGSFDMILINQLPTWISKESFSIILPEIWDLLSRDGIIALYQPLRPSFDIPWPDEWLLRVIEGFNGYPTKSDILKQFSRRSIQDSSVSVNRQSIVPILAYAFST